MALTTELSAIQVRILGCLVEKEATTPDQYPLTLNALKNACNQKTNRFPITNYYEGEIGRNLRELGDLRLVSEIWAPRAPKYKHHLQEVLEILGKEKAVLCVLMLRGPQTAGEIRGRCQRLHAFDDVDDVEYVLGRLGERDPAYVTALPRQAGQKEGRWMHLLAGAPDPDLMVAAPAAARSSLSERVAALESEIAGLKRKIEELIGGEG